MCGIVGLVNMGATAITQQQMNIFMQLLHSDALRGMHGTGAFAIDKDAGTFRIKVGGPPHQLVASKEFDKFEKFVGTNWVNILVGHNRYATRGEISTAHSHPFRHDHIILVHNGTLDSFKHLPEAKSIEVDSEAICKAISIDGPEKTIGSLKGAWALAWYNTKEKTLNLLRNKERPLFFAKHKTDPWFAFASEGEMLQWILHRNGVHQFELESVPEDTLYTWTLGDIKPKVKLVKGKDGKKYKDPQWDAWADRGSITETSQTTELVTDLTAKPNSDSFSQSNNSMRRSLPSQSESAKRYKHSVSKNPTNPQRGSWTAVDFLHTITKGEKITIMPQHYKAIKNETNKANGIFQVRGMSDDFPDIDFFCNIQGEEALLAVMEAPEGLRGQIVTILRSMVNVAQIPHQVYMRDPEPMYTEDPKVPSHALIA